MVFVVLLTEENDQLKLVLQEEYMIVIHVQLLPYLHLTLVDRTFAHCWFYWSWLSRHLFSPIEFNHSYMYFDLLAVGPDLVYSPLLNRDFQSFVSRCSKYTVYACYTSWKRVPHEPSGLLGWPDFLSSHFTMSLFIYRLVYISIHNYLVIFKQESMVLVKLHFLCFLLNSLNCSQ